MNIRRLSLNRDFTVTPTDSSAASQPFGCDPNFQAVGRPWRYEFPHQPSTSIPELQPRFTVPMPKPVVQPVIILKPVVVPLPQSGTTQSPASPLVVDPSDPT